MPTAMICLHPQKPQHVDSQPTQGFLTHVDGKRETGDTPGLSPMYFDIIAHAYHPPTGKAPSKMALKSVIIAHGRETKW